MLPQIGKLDQATFDRLILPGLVKTDRTVLIGPQHGVGASVVELPDGSVIVKADTVNLFHLFHQPKLSPPSIT